MQGQSKLTAGTEQGHSRSKTGSGRALVVGFVCTMITPDLNDTGVHPVGDRVLLRRDPKKNTYKDSAIVMPDGYDSWPWTGTILEVGPQVKDPEIVAGVKVMFQPKGSSALIPDNREGGRAEWERVVRVPEENILGIVEDVCEHDSYEWPMRRCPDCEANGPAPKEQQ